MMKVSVDKSPAGRYKHWENFIFSCYWIIDTIKALKIQLELQGCVNITWTLKKCQISGSVPSFLSSGVEPSHLHCGNAALARIKWTEILQNPFEWQILLHQERKEKQGQWSHLVDDACLWDKSITKNINQSFSCSVVIFQSFTPALLGSRGPRGLKWTFKRCVTSCAGFYFSRPSSLSLSIVVADAGDVLSLNLEWVRLFHCVGKAVGFRTPRQESARPGCSQTLRPWAAFWFQ